MTKTTLIAALCVAVLPGCGAVGRVVRADVPVPVAVQTPKVDKPVFAMDLLPLGSGIYDQTNACLAEREQRKAYELQLEAGWQALQAPVKTK